jgi:hypothetical protein
MVPFINNYKISNNRSHKQLKNKIKFHMDNNPQLFKLKTKIQKNNSISILNTL